MDWVLHTAKIPPERIVILGQSLGTAVASAVGLKFADPANKLLPGLGDKEARPLLNSHSTTSPTTFAGIILVAPFSSLPSLLLTYRIGGFLPILLPLRPIPWIANHFASQIIDKWPTADRLAAYYDVLSGSPRLHGEGPRGGRSMGTVQIFHAVNDFDIPYHESRTICRRMLGAECFRDVKGPTAMKVNVQGRPKVWFQILGHGGMSRPSTIVSLRLC